MTKKIGRPRGKNRPETQTVRVPVETLSRIDTWRAAQPDEPARPEAVRRLIDRGLKGERLPKTASPTAKIADQIATQKEILGALPPSDPEPSPEAGMNTMRRAVAENELVELKNVRRRTRKP